VRVADRIITIRSVFVAIRIADQISNAIAHHFRTAAGGTAGPPRRIEKLVQQCRTSERIHCWTSQPWHTYRSLSAFGMLRQILLLLIVIEPQMLTPRLWREHAMRVCDAVDLGFAQVIADS